MNTFSRSALEKLALTPSKTSLLEFIRWLDLKAAEALSEPIASRTLARCVSVLGPELVKKEGSLPSVAATTKIAEDYAKNPTEDNFNRYFKSATSSYPFGSGEGCFAVEELGYPSCEPGSGCNSGAGTLYQIALTLGVDETMEILREKIPPWLAAIDV